jgi:hypothetical protein
LLYSRSLLEGEALATDVESMTIERTIIVGNGQLLPIDSFMVAPEPLNVWHYSPSEVMAVRDPIMSAITVIQFRR